MSITNALLEALADLHQIHSEEKVYTFALNRASDVLKAQGGTYFTVDAAKGELIPEAAKGVSLALLKEVPFKLKLGISGWCATNRKPVRADNVQTDERFNRAIDVITGIRTRSILCVPVVRKETIFGVIELVNRVDGVFREADQEFLQFFARQVGVAIENCRARRAVTEERDYGASLVASAGSGLFATDLKGIVTACNPAARRILGLGEVLGQTLAQALADFPPLVTALETTQKRQAPMLRQDAKVKRPDGASVNVGFSTFIIRGPSQNLGVAMIFQDITAR